MSRHDVASDKFCCLERLVTDSAAALFRIVNADVSLDELLVFGITAKGYKTQFVLGSLQSRTHN